MDNGIPSDYTVTDGTNTYGPYNYGDEVTINGLPSTGATITMEVQDSRSLACSFTFEVMQDPCSECIQTVEAGPDATMGCGTPTTLLQGSSSDPGTVVWVGPDGFMAFTDTATVSAPGTYVYEVSYTDGCVAEDSLVVSQDASDPSINLGPDIQLSCTNSEATITAQINLTADFLIEWLDTDLMVIATGPTFMVTLADTLFARVTNLTNGCVSPRDRVVIRGFEPLQLAIIDSSIVCDDNGTPSDVSDDQSTITLTISSNIPGIQANLSINGVSEGLFDVNTPLTFVRSSDGSEMTVSATATVGVCTDTTDEIVIGTLNTCSPECLLMLVDYENSCNNNGTESDAGDDFYEFTVLASAMNGSASGTYEIWVNNTLAQTFTYGTTASFTLPANGLVTTIEARDTDDLSCSIDIDSLRLRPCSNNCFITLDILETICNDNGTDLIEDDFYQIVFSSSGQNTASGFVLSANGVVQGSYTYDGRDTITVPAGVGTTVNLEAIDMIDTLCTATVGSSELLPCSSPCEITEVMVITNPGNNAGTNDTEDDDFFSVIIRLEKSVTSEPSTYTVTWGGMIWGPFEYGQDAFIDSLPADGEIIKLVTIDSESTLCTECIEVSQMPCSQCSQFVEAGAGGELSCLISSVSVMALSSEPGTYEWIGPNGQVGTSLSANLTFPGLYTFRATYPDGCTAEDTLRITLDQASPFVDAGPDQLLTCDMPSVTLSPTINLNAAFAIEWRDSLGNVIANTTNLTVSSPGIYQVVLTDLSNNCQSPIDQLRIFDLTAPPLAIIYADPVNILDCVVDEIALTGEDVPNTIKQWRFNNQSFTTDRIVVTEEGTALLTVIDTITGCSADTMLAILDLEEYPLINFQSVGWISCIDTMAIINAGGSQVGGNIVYQWLDSNLDTIDGETGLILEVTIPGIYYLAGKDLNNGCENIDAVVVEDRTNFPQILLADNGIIDCDEDMTTVSAMASLTDTAIINWSTIDGQISGPQNSLEITALSGGSYVINIDNGEGCIEEDTIEVVRFDPPESVLLSNDALVCEGQSDAVIEVEDVVGGTPPYQYQLNGGALTTRTLYENLGAGSYTVQVVDANGCSESTTVTIISTPNPSIDLIPFVNVIQGDDVQLSAEVAGPASQIASIIWSPSDNLSCTDCLDPIIIQPSRDTIYTLTVIDINGCESSVTVRLDVSLNIVYTHPNVINTESNTGNNGFTIFANENIAEVEELLIFDRWGEMVFENRSFLPNNPADGWDGRFRNKPVVTGVYVFYARIRTVEGEKIDFSGDVTVLR